MIKDTIKKGFTMVELTLAMLFISIILMTIAWLTIHITSTYEKGLAMKSVNATAKELIDDFSRAIAGSPAFTVESQCSYYTTGSSAYKQCIGDNARKFSYQQNYGMVSIRGKDPILVPTNGVFCTGRYSYLWNTAYVLDDEEKDYKPTFGDSVKGKFFIGTEQKNENYRMLKVQDFDRYLCTQHITSTSAYLYNQSNEYRLESDPGTIIDLFDNTENNLALYDFVVFSPTIHKVTGAGFYSGTFILATLRGGVDISAAGDFCADPPDGLNTDFAYCSINKFNFSMRAAGERMLTEK